MPLWTLSFIRGCHFSSCETLLSEWVEMEKGELFPPFFASSRPKTSHEPCTYLFAHNIGADQVYSGVWTDDSRKLQPRSITHSSPLYAGPPNTWINARAEYESRPPSTTHANWLPETQPVPMDQLSVSDSILTLQQGADVLHPSMLNMHWRSEKRLDSREVTH